MPELLPKPPDQRASGTTRRRSGRACCVFHRLTKKGAELIIRLSRKRVLGENGQVRKLHGVRIEWKRDEKGQMKMVEAPGSEFELDAELVLLAMGFNHPVHEGMIQQLGVNLDPRGNVMIDANHMTSKEKGVFVAGDMAIGQSLVVRAIKQGRNAARGIDKYLMGETQLP